MKTVLSPRDASSKYSHLTLIKAAFPEVKSTLIYISLNSANTTATFLSKYSHFNLNIKWHKSICCTQKSNSEAASDQRQQNTEIHTHR